MPLEGEDGKQAPESDSKPPTLYPNTTIGESPQEERIDVITSDDSEPNTPTKGNTIPDLNEKHTVEMPLDKIE